MRKFTDEEARGFPLTGGDDAPTEDEFASSRREAWDPDSSGTTVLAAQIAASGRIGDSAYFDELAAQYGHDFTGTAFVQAFLKVAQEREQASA